MNSLVLPSVPIDPNTMLAKGGYIFFWDGWPSNWWPSKFTVDGVAYNCMEQFMMAEKARTFCDDHVLVKIMESPYPKAQKEFGRKVRGYDDYFWSRIRRSVVLHGTLEKYRQNDDMRALLLATEGTFVEASPCDTVWGIGLSIDHASIEDPKKWRGQNLLGQVITEAREILQAERNAVAGVP